jgi:hypothetical protein
VDALVDTFYKQDLCQVQSHLGCGLTRHTFEERLVYQECGESPGVLVQVQKVRNIGMA